MPRFVASAPQQLVFSAGAEQVDRCSVAQQDGWNVVPVAAPIDAAGPDVTVVALGAVALVREHGGHSAHFLTAAILASGPR
jgi:hypothetical protein